MKQNSYIEKKAFSSNGQTIKEAVARFERTKYVVPLPFTIDRIHAVHLTTLLLDKYCQALGRDGPPGQARSPGTHFMKIWSTGLFTASHSTIIQPNFIKLKFNHLRTLNFKIMKKQILFLTFFVLAISAGTSNVFGQALSPGITNPSGTNFQPIDTLSCVSTSLPLHPFPGVPYTYKMDGTTGDEVVSTWTWWATKQNTFISGGANNYTDSLTVDSGDLVEVGPTYCVPNTLGDSVTITWSADILSRTIFQGAAGEPTFVVGFAKGENCSDNIQVFEINPKPNFTIDIANIDYGTVNTMAWDDTTSHCVDNVQSAIYNNTTFEIDMDYGRDTIYFEVAAANFVANWTPTFTVISGLASAQTAEIALYETLADAQSAGTQISSGTLAANGSTYKGSTLTATNPEDIAIGVSVFVRVIIINDTEESLAVSHFSLAVDAQDDTETGIWDMEDEDCSTLADAADQVDFAIHTIEPRPTIIMDAGAMGESNSVEPDDKILKTP